MGPRRQWEVEELGHGTWNVGIMKQWRRAPSNQRGLDRAPPGSSSSIQHPDPPHQSLCGTLVELCNLRQKRAANDRKNLIAIGIASNQRRVMSKHCPRIRSHQRPVMMGDFWVLDVVMGGIVLLCNCVCWGLMGIKLTSMTNWIGPMK